MLKKHLPQPLFYFIADARKVSGFVFASYTVFNSAGTTFCVREIIMNGKRDVDDITDVAVGN